MLCNKLEQRAQSYLFAESDSESVRVQGGVSWSGNKVSNMKKMVPRGQRVRTWQARIHHLRDEVEHRGRAGPLPLQRHCPTSPTLSGAEWEQTPAGRKPFREGRRLSQQHTNLYCYRIRCSKSTRLLCLDIRTGLGERHPYTVSFVIRNVVVVLRFHCVLSLGSTKWWPCTAWLN